MLAPANRHPTNRSLDDFHKYWGESHGPLYSKTEQLRRYVQHLTLHEAYDDDPRPTWDGASMFWFDDLESMLSQEGDPNTIDQWNAVIEDDAQLFDRSTEWPTDHRKASVIGVERVVLEGATTPDMVKGVFAMLRRPGLTIAEFSDHWHDVHGPLVAELPGIRRYVQVHGMPESYTIKEILAPTHDGFSELWFDDYAALRSAMASPEWAAIAESGERLFAKPVAYVPARERIQKEFS
jgi:uncharacterized protein (TIGR02118 family)